MEKAVQLNPLRWSYDLCGTMIVFKSKRLYESSSEYRTLKCYTDGIYQTYAALRIRPRMSRQTYGDCRIRAIGVQYIQTAVDSITNELLAVERTATERKCSSVSPCSNAMKTYSVLYVMSTCSSINTLLDQTSDEGYGFS